MASGGGGAEDFAVASNRVNYPKNMLDNVMPDPLKQVTKPISEEMNNG